MNATWPLKPVGTIVVEGSEYTVCCRDGAHGVAQLAWVVTSGMVAAKVGGFVRGELRVCDKDPRLAWPDGFDDEVTADVAQVWVAAGLVRLSGASSRGQECCV